MYETEADLTALQDLLDRSYAPAGPHLRAVPRYGAEWEQFLDSSTMYARIDAERMFTFSLPGEATW